MKKLITCLCLLLALPSFASGFDSIHPTDMVHFIETHNPVIYLAAFFCLGLFLAFTPCVLPMVPILSGIIAGQSNHTKERSLSLSFAYVIGMSITYAIAGMSAAYFGSTVQTLMQQPIIIASFSGLFVLMALWLLGIFEMRIPSVVPTRQFKSSQKKNGVASAALMGILSTLVVSPCVTAPLIGILSYIAQSGKVLQGGLLLFVLALGMGVPLLLIGAGYGKILPRTGAWMIKIKQLFAILMLAMAIWFLGRVLPQFWLSLLWVSFLVISALILGIGRHEPAIFGRVLQSVAVVSLMVAGALIHQNLWSGKPQINQSHALSAPFQRVGTLTEIRKQLSQAKAAHKPVFIEFFASWCSDCQSMDKQVFNQIDVINAMKNTVNLRVSIGEKNEAVAEIKKKFGIYGIPTLLFYNAQGQELHELTSVGQISKQQMLHLLQQFNSLN